MTALRALEDIRDSVPRYDPATCAFLVFAAVARIIRASDTIGKVLWRHIAAVVQHLLTNRPNVRRLLSHKATVDLRRPHAHAFEPPPLSVCISSPTTQCLAIKST